jgi:hypothetical protein
VASDVTLQALIDLARLYSDQRPGGNNAFVPDVGSGSVTTLVNGACAELYDLLIQAGGQEYFVKDGTINIVPATSVYALPTDFYQLQTVHLPWQPNDWEYVPSFEQAERMKLVNFTSWGRRTPKGYRISGVQLLATGGAASIEFLPTPTLSIGATIRYIPVVQPLVNLTDTFSTINGWKLIPLKVALELRTVAGKDPGTLAGLYSAELDRVQGLADQRAQGATPQITDVDAYRQMPEWAADRRWI